MAKKVSEKKRLVILDSHAILHRAYHAIPADFSTSKGEPTNALYGLSSMLLKSIQELKPDYIIAASDRPEKTHRHKEYKEYKATRTKTDPELVEQLGKAPVIFKAFGVPVYDAAGFEADDVIGTIAKQMSKTKDIETIIVTGDFDIFQLISQNKVEVYRLLVGITNTKFYDEAAVREKLGFGPELVPDLKGIMGDSSDNIKGVPGVGEGSATKLITTYGGLKDIYKAIKKDGVETVAQKTGVQKRYIQLVADNEETAMFSKDLATIRTDVPITFSVPTKPWKLIDHAESISAMCDELEFRSIKERVRGIVSKDEVKEEKKEEVALPVPEIVVDPRVLRETSIATWLLHSETTNPSLEDILNFANTGDFENARKHIFDQLKKTGKLQEVFDTLEKPLMPICERMQSDGIELDVKYLKVLAKEYNKGLAEIAGRIFNHAGHEFNINSPKQLGVVLYDELKINEGAKQKKTAGGARTTREDELVKMKEMHPIIVDVLAYRELQKLLSTYIEKMPQLVDKESRLHPEFLQAGAATGRMASQNPGIQNIPIKTENGRRIRSGFVASKGYSLVSIDYSQIELRIAAGLSGDKKLVSIFKSGGDIHAAVASEVFNVAVDNVDREMRRRAKVINFGILYGMGVNALRGNLGTSREEAALYLSKYFSDFAGLAEYLEKTKSDAARLGYTETLFGRRRYYPGFKSTLPNLRAMAERAAINAPIQGTSADIIKLAMIQTDQLIEKRGWREQVRLLLSVHDELVYEIKKEVIDEIAPQIRHTMESVVDPKEISGVPIVAEAKTGPNWGNLVKLK